MNLKERNVPSAKIYIPPQNLEERKKVSKFAKPEESQSQLLTLVITTSAS